VLNVGLESGLMIGAPTIDLSESDSTTISPFFLVTLVVIVVGCSLSFCTASCASVMSRRVVMGVSALHPAVLTKASNRKEILTFIIYFLTISVSTHSSPY